MELHQGSFDLQSTVGSGTTATIVFPPERAVAAAVLEASRPAA
jgi:signal transduction histidine kinase